MGILDLVGGSQVKLAIIGVVLVVVGLAVAGNFLYINSLKKDIVALEKVKSDLEAANKIFQVNNDILKDNQSKCVAANTVSQNTTKALISERKDATAAITALAAAALSDKETIAKLSAQATSSLTDPKNDGPVAPVLRETVRGIQDSRRVVQ
jgi:hypothetical protein